MEEKQNDLDAFNQYFEYKQSGYTTNKAIYLLHEKIGTSERSIWNWYKEFDWKIKEQERQAEVNRIIEKEQNEEIAKNKVKYLKINHKLLDKFINDDFPIEIESIKDYDIIIKLCLLLQEEATVINKGQNINIDVVKDYNELFDEDLMEKILHEEEELEEREDIPE